MDGYLDVDGNFCYVGGSASGYRPKGFSASFLARERKKKRKSEGHKYGKLEFAYINNY